MVKEHQDYLESKTKLLNKIREFGPKYAKATNQIWHDEYLNDPSINQMDIGLSHSWLGPYQADFNDYISLPIKALDESTFESAVTDYLEEKRKLQEKEDQEAFRKAQESEKIERLLMESLIRKYQKD